MDGGSDHNIILIGFMGTGKSTLAKHLSEMYGMEMIEMDEVIAGQEQMSIPEIFQKYGEGYFRDRETELLIKTSGRKNTVISCGGGVPLRERNVAVMKKNGRVVLLSASPEVICERIKNDNGRPLLAGRKNVEEISKLMERRREKYEAAADIVIHTDNRAVSEIAREIMRRLMEEGEADV